MAPRRCDRRAMFRLLLALHLVGTGRATHGRMKRLLISAAEGALGAAAGMLLMRKSMPLIGKLPKGLQPDEMKGDPTEYVISQAERAAHRNLPERQRAFAKKSTPWLYGITWGALLGVLAPKLDLRSPGRAIGAGAALGAGV